MSKINIKLISAAIFISIFYVTLTTAMAFELQWYGQSAFKIETPGGKVILIDPFITKNPKTPEKLKDLDKIGNIDLILVTHGHGDHVGDTAQLSEKTGAKAAMNADMGSTFAALGWVPYERIIGFNKSGSIMPIGEKIKITMVHAEHSSEVVHTDSVSNEKSVHPGGEPAGYIIQLENGYKIYHAGDTGVFSDMKIISELYKPDLVMLPIGGHYTMDPEHAAYAVKHFFKESKIIPMHYGTFPPLKGTPEELKKYLKDVPVEIIEMSPGEIRSF